MDAWNTGNNYRPQPRHPTTDPALITQEFQRIQYFNYINYIEQMKNATGEPNPYMMTHDEFANPAHTVTIEGLPPGRPQTLKGSRDKPKFTKAPMTYGEHRRMLGLTDSPPGASTSQRNHTSSASQKQHSRGFDPRQEKSTKNTVVDDGWDSPTATTSFTKKAPSKDDDWDDETPSAKRSKNNVSSGDWDDEMPSSSNSRKTEAVKSDGWDLSPAKKAVASKPDDDWDEWDDGPRTKTAVASNQSNDWDEPSTAVATTKKTVVSKPDDDWDEWDNGPRTSAPAAAEVVNKSKKSDDWSDDEDTKTAKVVRSDSTSSYRVGSSNGSSRNDRVGSHGSRNNSDSRGGRNFSRDRSSSFRDNSRESSKDRGGSDRSSGTNRGGKRQPRDDDWTCTKCSGYNFPHRNDCFRCKEPKDDAASSTHSSSSSNHRNGRSFEKRQPREGDWTCSKCSGYNFPHRTDCFRCNEPKDDTIGITAGSSFKRESGSSYGRSSRDGGGYRDRTSSSSSRGDYRSNDRGSGRNVSKSVNVSSTNNGDGWDDENEDKVKAAVKVHKPKIDDDDWDIPDIILPNKIAAKVVVEDEWDSVEMQKAPLETSENDDSRLVDMSSEPKKLQADAAVVDDEWDTGTVSSASKQSVNESLFERPCKRRNTATEYDENDILSKQKKPKLDDDDWLLDESVKQRKFDDDEWNFGCPIPSKQSIDSSKLDSDEWDVKQDSSSLSEDIDKKSSDSVDSGMNCAEQEGVDVSPSDETETRNSFIHTITEPIKLDQNGNDCSLPEENMELSSSKCVAKEAAPSKNDDDWD